MSAVFGICGWSGCGKTTLIERLLPHIRARGLSAGVLKHAHHNFDIDVPGKDSRRFREAGCSEVAISSARRWAFIRELAADDSEAALPELLRHFSCDLVLVEGYKNAAIPKMEVWRAGMQPPIALDNPHVLAIATDGTPPPHPPQCAILPLNDAAAVVDFIVQSTAKAA